jgi:serine-type D-Ala-D-Ala carboxypeptidase
MIQRRIPRRVPSALATLFVLVACERADDSARVEEILAGLDLEARVGQLVLVATDESTGPVLPTRPDGPAPWETAGFWFDAAAAGQVAASARLLGPSTELPHLVGGVIDQGAGAVVAGATTFPPLARLLRVADPGEVREVGSVVAAEASSAGLNLGLVRLPPMRGGPDWIGFDPEIAADRLAAFLSGTEREGLATAVQVLWSPGADSNSPAWHLGNLEALELPLLLMARDRGAAALMPGPQPLPSISGDFVPANRSPATVSGLLRRDLGWDRLILADLRIREPADAPEIGEAAVEAIGAGVDLVIVDGDPAVVLMALTSAVREGRLAVSRVDDAARAVIHARLRLPVLPDPAEWAPDPRGAELSRTVGERVALPAGAGAAEPAVGARVLEVVDPADVGINAALLQAADRAILAALNAGSFSAAALVVGRRGGVVRLRGYGTTPDGSAVDPRTTIFDLASLTKVVATASAVASLVESGQMELLAPVERYVSEFEGGEKDEVTIWHLLTHTSGLPPGLALFGSAASPAHALEQVIRQPLRRSPGVQVEYSDLGMILLAEAIERASGKPLDHLLTQRVFAPLGMESTMFLPPLAFHGGVVPTAIRSERPFTLQGVVHDGNAFRLGGVTGHAGLFSTPADLAIFAQTMLNGGSYGAVRVFAESTVRQFTARQPGAGSRALGWDTPEGRSSAGRFLSARTFGHTGYTGTSLWIDPERDLFVILLTNRTYTRATTATMLNVRIAVHEAVARAIADQPVVARAGAR